MCPGDELPERSAARCYGTGMKNNFHFYSSCSNSAWPVFGEPRRPACRGHVFESSMSGPSRHSGIISDAAVNLMTVSRIGVIALLFSVGAIIAAGGGLARGGPPMQFTLSPQPSPIRVACLSATPATATTSPLHWHGPARRQAPKGSSWLLMIRTGHGRTQPGAG